MQSTIDRTFDRIPETLSAFTIVLFASIFTFQKDSLSVLFILPEVFFTLVFSLFCCQCNIMEMVFNGRQPIIPLLYFCIF